MPVLPVHRAQLLAKEGQYVTVRMPSGETRYILETCSATIGQVGNTEHGNVNLGKAGPSSLDGLASDRSWYRAGSCQPPARWW